MFNAKKVASGVLPPSKWGIPAYFMKKEIFIIIIVACAVYANTLKNGFVYDDILTIVGNAHIKDISNLPKLLDRESYFTVSSETSYRPAVTLTYFLNYSLFGLKPWGYHLTNILIHALNSVLLYLFLVSLSRSSDIEGLEAGMVPLPASIL